MILFSLMTINTIYIRFISSSFWASGDLLSSVWFESFSPFEVLFEGVLKASRDYQEGRYFRPSESQCYKSPDESAQSMEKYN